ncbi:MAG: PilZ domain-containing protein [Bdellovibrionaceae bacterium]|nr:PilZ domain-containing protein [Pseudobdellovibrionaceae bacterium]MBX3032673.1 PilZ domain-containing protein [Pseudobdellovibrionaceae bacterium]
MKATGKIWIIYDAVTQKQTKPMATLQAQITLLNLKGKSPERYFLWTPGWTEWIPLVKFMESPQPFFVFAPAPAPSVEAAKKIDDEKTIKIEKQIEDTITHVMSTEFDEEDGGSPYTEILPAEPKPAKKRDDYGYYHEDFSAEKIDPDAKPSVAIKMAGKKNKPSEKDRRIAERHSFRIEVILISKTGRTFRTNSKNISTGGTLLEDDLPKEFLNIQFDLILVNKFEKDSAKGRLHFQGRVVGDYNNPRRLMFLDGDEHTFKRLEALLASYGDHRQKARKKASSGS